MRRYLLLGLLGVGLALQSGCALYYPDERGDGPFSYCDDTGCYECNDYECWQVSPGGGGGYYCSSNWDCAGGCYCDVWNTGTCIETGFCSSDADCWDGFVCDDRASCVPPETVPPPGCASDDECAAGCYCDEATGVCVEAGFCDSDADCPVGMACDSRSSCVPVGCTSDDQCAAGCYCDDAGNCAESGYCTQDSDCSYLGAEWTCDEARGTCIPDEGAPPPPPPPPPPQGCTVDADCTAGQICCDGECKDARPDVIDECTGDGMCGGGDCVDGLCHQACATDADCGTGDICDAASGTCWSNAAGGGACVFNVDCGAGFTCINAFCHTNCASDADCANPADFCDMGVCQPDWRVVSECSIDADCNVAADEECVDGQCLTRCMQDLDCAACPDGPICTAGYCGE
jgi:hypothetical protein